MASPAADPATPNGPPQRASFIADLRAVLAERDFRRLFAVRLISQTGDGVFTAGLGSYVFFNATKFPDPASAAIAFAVLYLPYSLIGPFAGVFIDRWSRRQILLWSALVRAAFVTFTALLVTSGNLGVPLYVAVLLVLGVNRFFLSSLSAALPHVVPEDKLVMANAVSPTAGGILAGLGGVIALGVHVITGAGQGGSAITLLVAGGCYVLASTAATTMARDLLGPDTDVTAGRPSLATDLVIVAKGLADGARFVWRRPMASAVLGVTGAQRAIYGILFLMSILLYRNYFYKVAGANSALGHYSLLVAVSAVGYGAAALITPQLSARIGKAAAIVVLLLAAVPLAGPVGATFNPLAFLAVGFGLNLVAQGCAICAVTILQEEVDDAYRGRVFAFYDVVYNVLFVAAAGIAAVFLPLSGKSFAMVGVAGFGYLLAALSFAAFLGWGRAAQRRRGVSDGVSGNASGAASGEAPGDASGGAAEGVSGVSPSASAQRSSS